MAQPFECPVLGCNAPKGRGRPHKGWVRVEADFIDGGREVRWFCSWRCLSRMAAFHTKG